MINAEIVRGAGGEVTSFTVKNHGDSIVCAAVSMLVLNTINSIEALTKQDFDCDYDEDGGYIHFAPKGPPDAGAELLVKAMLLGLTSVQEEYAHEIIMKEM